MIRSVLFDYYNTLVETPSFVISAQACFEADLPLYTELANSLGMDALQLATAVDEAVQQQGRLARQGPSEKEHDVVVLYQVAMRSIEITACPGWILRLIDAEQQAYCRLLRPASEAVEVLATLQSQGYALGIISNEIYPHTMCCKFLSSLICCNTSVLSASLQTLAGVSQADIFLNARCSQSEHNLTKPLWSATTLPAMLRALD